MHIALFIYSLRGGGAQQRALTLANGFAARGHVVDLVVIADDNAGIALHSGVRVVVLKQGWRHLFERLNRRINLRGLFTACAIPALARYLRDEHPEVLLSGASHVNLVATFAHRFSKMNIPLVLRASNYPSGNIRWWPPFEQAVHRLLRWTLGVVYPWADHIIAVSQGVAREVQRLTGLPATDEVAHLRELLLVEPLKDHRNRISPVTNGRKPVKKPDSCAAEVYFRHDDLARFLAPSPP